jgi:hypothetical protein
MDYYCAMETYTYNNRRIVQHTDTHYDIEELRHDEDGNCVSAVIYCSLEEDMLQKELRVTPEENQMSEFVDVLKHKDALIAALRARVAELEARNAELEVALQNLVNRLEYHICGQDKSYGWKEEAKARKVLKGAK